MKSKRRSQSLKRHTAFDGTIPPGGSDPPGDSGLDGAGCCIMPLSMLMFDAGAEGMEGMADPCCTNDNDSMLDPTPRGAPRAGFLIQDPRASLVFLNKLPAHSQPPFFPVISDR